MCIKRAHRLGSLKQDAKDKVDSKRPIIVKFRDNVDTETVMNRAYMLKNLPFGVERDYPRKIADARKQPYTCEIAKKQVTIDDRKTVQIRLSSQALH